MEKINKQTPDLTSKNIAKITELFPNVITEKEDENGRIVKAVDFDLLRQELSKDIVEGGDERYRLDWPGKRRSMLKANTPINKTLKPDRDSSVNFDTTENVYIEGDNFEVLKIIQESYLGKIKMIYIDPPYNTGKDFVYRDNFKVSKNDYEGNLGIENEEGGKLFKNTDTNGRFHSDWLSMMYERLLIARDLLKDDGVIFISIDDNEVHNLRKIADEIFGEINFVAQIIVEATPKNDPHIVSTAHEYALVYTKDIGKAKLANYGIGNPLYQKIVDIFNKNNGNYEKIKEELNNFYKKEKLIKNNISNYKYADGKGVYRIGPIDDPQSSGPTDERINPKTGNPCKVPNRGWSCTIETWNEWVKDDLIRFPDNDDVIPDKKTYITADRIDVMKALFKVQTRKDTIFLKELFGTNITPFSNPKPQSLLKEFIKNTNDKEAIYLDFFAGSGSFGQAVIENNVEDDGNRKFILVQIPEEIIESGSNKEKKIAKAAIDFLNSINKPTNIAELSKERIRRSGKKILKENAEKLAQREKPLDIGFRSYKVADSIMQDVYKSPNELKQSDLLELADNIKRDKSPEDILTSVILDLGLTLDLPIKEEKIGKNIIYNVADGSLLACFDKDIDFSIIDEIAKIKPLRVVFRDASFKDDKDRINVETKFKQLSPDTRIKVL
ncbi:MAG: site-specific DNA-methyltransferase [Minisyncoccales bacterium]|jgi:adenine-specific DNA-methyltransferase